MIRYIIAGDEARTALTALAGQTVGLDIETTGLDPLTCKTRLVQVAPASGPTLVMDMFGITGGLWAIAEELCRLRPVCHNALFEMGFLTVAGIRISPDCTMLAHHALFGTAASLEDLAKQYLGAELDKQYQKSNWSGELSAEQLQYAALDAVVTLQLWHLFEPAIEAQRAELLYRLMVNAQRAVTTMHLRGMPFNAAQHCELIERLSARQTELLNSLTAALGGRNPGSGKQMGEWLTEVLTTKELNTWPKTPKGALQTSRDVFRDKLDDLPGKAADVVGGLLLPYKLVAKQLSAFGPGLLEKVHPTTRRIHAHFQIAGPVTGRMSCAHPNLQQIPRGPDFRVLFQAPPGRKLIVADFSQIELRVAAHIAEEPTLLAAYREGVDTHTLTASLVLSKTIADVTKQERQTAKGINFGLIYGQQAPGLRNYVRRSYGVPLTVSQATQYRNAWFGAYPQFGHWHRVAGAEAEHFLSVVTPAGRIRRWAPAKFRRTEAFNTPVQGGAAECMLASLGELAHELNDRTIDAFPVAVVHDELILEAADECAPEATALLERAMIRGVQTIFPDACPTGLVEAHALNAWSEK